MRTTMIDSPIGPLQLVADAGALTAIRFGDETATDSGTENGPDEAILTAAAIELAEYFDGGRTEFTVTLRPKGTDFQRRVWDELLRIPYADTCSYRELAERIGKPEAIRAVGAANGGNPLPIVIPCHRVIGSDGSLTGYGGGLDVKRALLDLEAGERLF